MQIALFKKKKKKTEEFADQGIEEETSEARYIDEIEKLRSIKESPEILLDVFDTLVQDFFKKQYHLKKRIEYSELIDFFMEKNKPTLSDFCRRMTETLYGGEKVTHDKVNDLISDMGIILRKEEPTSEQRKKKAKGFSSFIDKISLFEDEGEKKFQFVGKKTKRIIRTKLQKKEEDKSAQIPVTQQQNLPQSNAEGSAALSFLNQSNEEQNPLSPDEEQEADQKIGSIDDLDRIKSRLLNRKKQQ